MKELILEMIGADAKAETAKTTEIGTKLSRKILDFVVHPRFADFRCTSKKIKNFCVCYESNLLFWKMYKRFVIINLINVFLW